MIQGTERVKWQCKLGCILWLLVCLGGIPMFAMAQGKKPASTKPKSKKEACCDTLYLRDGSKLDVMFEYFSEDSIHYQLWGLRPHFKIAKARVERVLFQNGKLVELERKEDEKPPTVDGWKVVEVTRKKNDIMRMVRLDNYDVKFNASVLQCKNRRSDMEQRAVEQLQKLAFQKGATHLYVEEMEYFASYGEPPEIRVVASCYRKLNHPLLNQEEKEEKKK